MIRGVYYDGQSSERQTVSVEITREFFIVDGLAQRLSFSTNEVKLSEPLGSVQRSITLPGGARIDVDDCPELDALAARSSAGYAWIHTIERKWRYALVAVVLVVTVIWLMITGGIPFLAKHAAFLLPAEMDDALGNQGLEILDRALFEPSRLDETRKFEFGRVFATLAEDVGTSRELRIEFRRSEQIGANAFALPSGIIVVTDELIELAGHEEEVLAVLAHEVGHVLNRHALRLLLQDSVTAALLVTLTGDITSVSALAASIPTVLVQTSYSREFEREADDFAYRYLDRRGIPASRFGDMLRRLDEESGDAGILNYLSTHPRASERIRK